MKLSLTPAELQYAQEVEDHHDRLVVGFAAAEAAEPGLRVSEWVRRNPFVPRREAAAAPTQERQSVKVLAAA